MKYFKLWFPVIVWAGFIFYLSSIPDFKTNLSCDFILRKIVHVTEYFILTLLLYNAFKNTFDLNTLCLFIYPAGIAVIYTISDEIHQLFVHGRSGSPKDVCIDCIGIFGFYLTLKILKKTYKRGIT